MSHPLRALLRNRVRAVVGRDGGPPLEYLVPAGDPGLFGPQSQVWRVHADFRLARTAQFIAATSYGGTAMAEAAIARVRAIHRRVVGQAPDGRSYRADDARLLYWVHLTESWSFLHAHLRFVEPTMPPAARDRYIAEMATIVARLGCEAPSLPAARIASSVAQAEADMLAYRGELDFSARARSVVALLHSHAAGGLPQRLVVHAPMANLPDWVWPLLQREPPPALQRRALNAAVGLLAQPLRWALADGIAAHARRRVN